MESPGFEPGAFPLPRERSTVENYDPANGMAGIRTRTFLLDFVSLASYFVRSIGIHPTALPHMFSHSERIVCHMTRLFLTTRASC